MPAPQAAAAVAAARWFSARSGQGARPCSAYGQNPLEKMGHAGIDDSFILRRAFRRRYRQRASPVDCDPHDTLSLAVNSYDGRISFWQCLSVDPATLTIFSNFTCRRHNPVIATF